MVGFNKRKAAQDCKPKGVQAGLLGREEDIIHLQFICQYSGLVPVFAERLLGIDFLQRHNVCLQLLNDSGEPFAINVPVDIDTAVNVVSRDPDHLFLISGFVA